MIKLSKKDSDHTDLYKNSKFDSISDGESETTGDDELYKFKKTVSLQRPYEIYLETEKTYQLYKKQVERSVRVWRLYCMLRKKAKLMEQVADEFREEQLRK